VQSAILAIAVFKFVVLIFSLSVHECSHAWMASRLGDHTARMQGRVTLNPMYHVDPVGSLLLPALMIFGPPLLGLRMFGGMLIGWAKPTPVISRNFTKIRRDENLVTLAGPASNLLIVLAAFLVLAVIVVAVPGGREIVMRPLQEGIPEGAATALQAVSLLCNVAIYINLILFFFNLFPIPPLDGSHLLRNILPYGAVQAYDRIPIMVSYLLMFFVGGYVLQFLMAPALTLVYTILFHV
jgi:Zn-dependent protease